MKLFITALSLLLVIACNQTAKEADDQVYTEESQNQLPADFEKFYLKFHEDTLFQLEHISFPLAGSPAMIDTIIVTDIPFFWEKKTWEYHASYDPATNFLRHFEVLSQEMILERFQHKELPLIMERRFAKISDGWRLIYYAAPAPGKRL